MRTWRISCHHLQAWAGAYRGGRPPTACLVYCDHMDSSEHSLCEKGSKMVLFCGCWCQVPNSTGEPPLINFDDDNLGEFTIKSCVILLVFFVQYNGCTVGEGSARPLPFYRCDGCQCQIWHFYIMGYWLGLLTVNRLTGPWARTSPKTSRPLTVKINMDVAGCVVIVR